MGDYVTEIPVSGSPGYSVFVGRGLLGDVGSYLSPRVAKVLIVHAPALAARAETLREQLSDRYHVFLAEVPPTPTRTLPSLVDWKPSLLMATA